MEPKKQNIKDVYKIKSTIGKGSFATVKMARHRETNNEVAVKVFSKKRMTDTDLEDLQNEKEVLMSVDHPNIVKLIEVFEDERHICIVMELMTGGELFEKVKELDYFSEIDARNCMLALIDSIRYLHQMGIVHRDIKPENMLLPSKDIDFRSLKLADFGLARFFGTD